ncbi:hypothetical protein SAMN02745166_01917 [Prosthecobacter debontii]|uniref:Uncharacterized protein n=1 Tax=Prosthecobacter debontii TaxID=48467 RepID=A0A1T4XSS4_9BACT|nr:hypothetical protein [Prosthecobacter debontii]SKA92600.1 hypothetical protein SAMN02745166_01917 [Prosthecobacter debontii]
MLWRILSALIVLFWAMMTGLIIRDTYFPDYSRFAVVPPRFVFDLFLSEAAAFNNTLHLYHEKERIGHTTFTIRKDGGEDQVQVLYALLASGMVTFPVPNAKDQDLNFRLTAELEDAERWHSLDLELKSGSADLFAVIQWKVGDELPQVEVKKGGQVVMNTEMMKTMMAMKGAFGGGFEWLAELGTAQSAVAEASPLHAREGIMELAGKKRRCYIVTWQVFQTEEIRIYFTEVGELARIELPQDYRFIEPMMHGLEKGLSTME